MRKRTLLDLADPNDRSHDFEIFGHVVETSFGTRFDIEHEQLTDDDDIRSGYVINKANRRAYPIVEFICCLLTDKDAPLKMITDLETALKYCSSHHTPVLENRIRILGSATEPTELGQRHQEEMAYYDDGVSTEEKRQEMVEDISERPLWHIFIERTQHLLQKLPLPTTTSILEIGCGNARTVSWHLRPELEAIHYCGTDISFKRLLVAKASLPEGDFIQCSALDLPFKADRFSAVISFGMLHHLCEPLSGVEQALEVLNHSGYLLMHEPIEKPAHIFKDDRWPRLRALFATYQHSEHDGELDLSQVKDFLQSTPNRVVHLHFSGSIIRTIGCRLLDVLGLSQSRIVWQVLILTDRLFNFIFCRRPNVLGPRALYLVLQKRTNH